MVRLGRWRFPNMIPKIIQMVYDDQWEKQWFGETSIYLNIIHICIELNQ